jgi:nitrous oxidase accessory protein NosD
MLDGGRRRAAIALSGAVAALLLVVAAANAARCGGDTPCACGDKVVADAHLTEDLGPCPKDGLSLEAPVTFDGGGHTIRGPGEDAAGLRIVEGASGAKISHVTLTGFHDGVRLIGASGVRLSDVESHGNGNRARREGYGIDVSSAASDNVLERVRVHHNADEGIHVGTDAARNKIVDAQVFQNGRENVYFLACHDNRLERSTLRGSGLGNASVYVKFATGTVVEGNTIEDGAVEVRGGARDTLLVGNTLVGGGVVLKSQNDKRFGPGRPAGTTVRGGKIIGAETCVRIDDGSGTRIEDVDLSCRTGVRVAEGSRVSLQPAPGSTQKVRVRCAGTSDCVDRPPSAKPPAKTRAARK